MKKWIEYDLELVTETPFRIGGVKPIPGTAEVSSPVVRIGDTVVIQGTSLKGAFRGNLEAYLIDTYYDKKARSWNDKWLKPCIPATGKNISPDEQKLIDKGLYKENCSYESTGSPDTCICPACYLLGAMGLIGFVNVPFLKLVKGNVEILQFIREDRATKTSAKGKTGGAGAIGKYEAVPEDSVFKGTLAVLEEDTVTGWKLGSARSLVLTAKDRWLESSRWTKEKVLTDLVEKRLTGIKQLGGFKSKGFGNVSIKLTRK
ncbi:MAG: RAMP superfamily CRISPR-associated protein [Candidatus Odinarchaeota archaeon]